MSISRDLSVKYDVPAPRYTSYPTVPFWQSGLDKDRWQKTFSAQFRSENPRDGISLYIHLPFCESLCIYCGCTKKITTNHTVEEKYIRTLLKEWKLYRDAMETTPVIREIHLGGGTPTFFSPGHLAFLIKQILKTAKVHPNHSFSIEGHPNNTSRAHLQVLYDLGFRRISYGIQDTNPDVQSLIHRIQPFENVIRATEEARNIGYTSVNFDLVYGLPGQDADKLIRTISRCLTLRPDRIAFYSYAHTPSVIGSQRLIDTSLLPPATEKLDMYLAGKALFTGHGYTDIGMDHFALPTDELYTAWKNSQLHRNFMGYTVQKSKILLGLGMSAISDIGVAYAQNSKTMGGYYKQIESGVPAIEKGYFLEEEDMRMRKHILQLSCQGSTTWDEAASPLIDEFVLPALQEPEKDGLVLLRPGSLQITSTGRHFIRNICKTFDLHLLRREKSPVAQTHGLTFSKAI